jgi:serine/threonine protein phosphatase 1
MSTYVISDLHGCKEEFDQMLQQIDFSQYDTMWILGDVCDRGNESVALLQEIMAHANMHMIMGNHDVWLSRYAQKLIDAKKDPASIEMNDDFLIWMHYNGGFKTADEFMDLPFNKCYDIKLYLETVPLYQQIEVGGRQFLLIHAGLGSSCRRDVRPAEVPEQELVWSHIELDDNPYEDVTMIVGHFPTFMRGREFENRIIRREKILHIDCGCVYGRALGCIRLNDMQEFYVPSTYPYLEVR